MVEQYNNYFPILAALVAAFGFAAVMLGINAVLGPKRPAETAPAVKLEPFECGSVPIQVSNRRRISVKFYLVAILFVMFDLETVLLYPWAVVYRDLGWFGFVELLIFMISVTIGLAYAWRKGGLEWR